MQIWIEYLQKNYKKIIPYVIAIGEDEMKFGKLTLKNMETGEQEQKTVEEIIEMMI